MATGSAVAQAAPSPYTKWRMLIVTPDYATLRKMQRLFAKRFQTIEFEMNGAEARNRVQDIFAPSFKVVVIDEKTVSTREAQAWRQSFDSLDKQPVVMLMAEGANSAPARIAATLGCVGILDITGPGQEIARQMLVSTGHLAPEPGDIIFDTAPFDPNNAVGAPQNLSQQVTKILGQFRFPKMPVIVRQLRAPPGKTIPAIQNIIEDASKHPLLGKALSRASGMIFRYQDLDRLKLAAQALGFEDVRELLVIASLQEAFSTEKHAISGFELKLWRMAITNGKCFQSLLQHYPDVAKVVSPIDALIHGIVTNAGMIMLFKKYPDYIDVTDFGFQWDTIGNDQCQWEARRYEIDHTLLGHQIAKNWALLPDLRMSIQHQHKRKPPKMSDVSMQLREIMMISDSVSLPKLYTHPDRHATKNYWKKLSEDTRLDLLDLQKLHKDVNEQMEKLQRVF